MKKLKRILMSLAVTIGIAAPALVPAVAHGQNTINDDGLRCGANLEFRTSGCDIDPDEAGGRVNSIIQTAINIISIIVAVAAVIMIIVAGFRYITSNGESSAVSGAKNTIIYAIVGLVVVALAQIIVRFVVGELTTETTTSD